VMPACSSATGGERKDVKVGESCSHRNSRVGGHESLEDSQRV
jgi:hypothetical protein